MNKNYRFHAPLRDLHGAMLRTMMEAIGASVDDLAKLFRVNERTVRRWLSTEDVPRAVLMALWHETPMGRYNANVYMGNELSHYKQWVDNLRGQSERHAAQLGRLLAIGDFGSANDPVQSPDVPAPGGGPRGFMPGPRYPARVLRSFGRRVRARC